MNNNSSTLMAGGIIIYVVIMLAVIAFAILVWWRIFSKAGYSGALGLLMLVPIANLIVLLMLAFGEWPILKELQALRQQVASRQSFPQGPQGYPQGPQGYPQGPQGQYPSDPRYQNYQG